MFDADSIRVVSEVAEEANDYPYDTNRFVYLNDRRAKRFCDDVAWSIFNAATDSKTEHRVSVYVHSDKPVHRADVEALKIDVNEFVSHLETNGFEVGDAKVKISQEYYSAQGHVETEWGFVVKFMVRW